MTRTRLYHLAVAALAWGLFLAAGTAVFIVFAGIGGAL